MKRLVIDSSTQTASVALFDGDQVIGEMVLNTPKTHSQKLMPLIESLLGFHEVKIKDIGEFLACEGPGSFTGVRIGLATVKALAQPFDIKIKTFTSMTLLALSARHHQGMIVSMIDAKRQDVYFGIYESDGKCLSMLEEGVENISSLLGRLGSEKTIMVLGDAVTIYDDIINEDPRDNMIFLKNVYPKAADAIALDVDSLAAHDYDDVHANYMRKSQAERDKL